jgi:hypothetical protein
MPNRMHGLHQCESDYPVVRATLRPHCGHTVFAGAPAGADVVDPSEEGKKMCSLARKGNLQRQPRHFSRVPFQNSGVSLLASIRVIGSSLSKHAGATFHRALLLHDTGSDQW